MALPSLPLETFLEQKGRDFRSLADISMASGVKITKEPIFEENVFF
ncbi:MAG: hypothetical protein M3M87_02685 [Thermoproteota archaeon]|nr:hypothetical protein [Thermoproteota archaeon]